MIKLWLLFLVDFFIAANYGLTLNNLSTQIQQMYSKSLASPFDYNDPFIQSMLMTGILIGSMIGSLSLSYLVDKVGRKKLVIILGGIGCVLNGLICIPVSWVYLFFMRILIGVPMAMTSTAIQAWLSELCSITQRAFVTTAFNVFLCIGIIMSSVILLILGNTNSNWWLSFATASVISIGISASASFLPDVQSNQNSKKCENELKWSTLLQKRYRKVLVNALLFGPGQQATGISSVLGYATLTFRNVFSDDPNDYYSAIYGSLLISTVNFAATCIALFVINRFGRRTLWFSGCAAVAVTHVMFIISYSQTKPNSGLIIASSVLFLIVYQLGPGPLFFVLSGESFPLAVRNKAGGLNFFMKFIVSMGVNLAFPHFKGIEWAIYVVYIVFMISVTIPLWWTLPETRGKSLEQIENDLIGQASETQSLIIQDILQDETAK